MTKENNEITQVMLVNDKDWFLQKLVHIVNLNNISFGITLNVGGFLVSGQLIGGKQYFEGFGDDFSSGFSFTTEAATDIKASFAAHGDIYSSNKESPPPSSPSYIHIKEAKFFNTNGNPIPNNKGVWWRGRISQIDGFSLGSLRAE